MATLFKLTMLFDRHAQAVKELYDEGQVSAESIWRREERFDTAFDGAHDYSLQITPERTVLPGFPSHGEGSVMNVPHLATLLYRVVEDDNPQFGPPDSKGRAWDLRLLGVLMPCTPT